MNRLLIFVVTLVVLAGCAEPGDATRTGALGGGAVGAGLGAIIGSQTGDPGAGVAIGALAGAGAGAAIGNAFDARDAAIRNQDEAIARQEQLLRAQQKEIRDLRDLSQDSPAFDASSENSPRARYGEPFGHSSRPGMVRVPAGPLKIPAHLRPQGESPSQRASTSSGWGGTSSDDRSRTMAYDNSFHAFDPPSESTIDTFEAREQRLKAFKSPEVNPASNSGQPSSVREAPVDFAQDTGNNIGAVEPAFYGEDRDANDLRAAVDNSVPQDNTVEESNIRLEDGSAPRPAFEEIEHGQTFDKPEEVATKGTVKEVMPVSAECQDAKSEIEQAMSASDTADKLFYYRRALRLCPDNPTYHTGMGKLYLTLGRAEDARFEFSEALRLDPTHEGATEGMKNLQKGGASDVAGAIIKGTSAERY